MGAQWKAKGKAQAADARGKLFGRLAKDIMMAAKSGADPAANSRLRLVVEQARKVSMPKDTLERAIKKGAGLLGDPVNFERVIYEGFAPHQVPVMVNQLAQAGFRLAQVFNELKSHFWTDRPSLEASRSLCGKVRRQCLSGLGVKPHIAIQEKDVAIERSEIP